MGGINLSDVEEEEEEEEEDFLEEEEEEDFLEEEEEEEEDFLEEEEEDFLEEEEDVVQIVNFTECLHESHTEKKSMNLEICKQLNIIFFQGFAFHITGLCVAVCMCKWCYASFPLA